MQDDRSFLRSFVHRVVSEEDFFFTSAQHEELMVAALNEALSSVFVMSPCPRLERLELLRGSIHAELKRGVNVDLLFGNMAGRRSGFPSGDMTGQARLHMRLHGKARDRLRYNRQPSSFEGNLLLWDGRGGWSACVGSYNWLRDNRIDASSPVFHAM